MKTFLETRFKTRLSSLPTVTCVWVADCLFSDTLSCHCTHSLPGEIKSDFYQIFHWICVGHGMKHSMLSVWCVPGEFYFLGQYTNIWCLLAESDCDKHGWHYPVWTTDSLVPRANRSRGCKGWIKRVMPHKLPKEPVNTHVNREWRFTMEGGFSLTWKSGFSVFTSAAPFNNKKPESKTGY